jgi:steroid delta-isomerase-like uncharacterized protein
MRLDLKHISTRKEIVSMSTVQEQNKATARSFYEGFNNWDKVVGLLAPDYLSYAAGAPGPLSKDQHEAMARSAVAAFPDLKLTIQEQIAEGDKVLTRLTTTGTHQGYFQGIPATGKRFIMEGWTLDRIVDGKIVEHRTIDDVMTMMRQLDLMPGG